VHKTACIMCSSIPHLPLPPPVHSAGVPRVSTAKQTSAASVQLGQHVLVRPGEVVPLDGRIVWGTSNCSLQHISGESIPIQMIPGMEVPAGSLSTDGTLVVCVSATSEDSTPARIARLAAEAQVGVSRRIKGLRQ